METISLFPLSTVLLPGGRLPLQIFETRYLDLVSRSLKQDTGFGVVWLHEGSEVQATVSTQPHLAAVGCYAKIVDWDKLDNGLLGITVEGQRRFRLLSSAKRDDQLYTGEVEWLPVDQDIAIPADAAELEQLLKVLMAHPHIVRLGISDDIRQLGALSFILSQLLPIEESLKFDILCEADPLRRLGSLQLMLDEMGQ